MFWYECICTSIVKNMLIMFWYACMCTSIVTNVLIMFCMQASKVHFELSRPARADYVLAARQKERL
jgi:hypothetical protein